MAQELGEYLTEEEVEKIFAKTDMDSDGYVTAEDFYTIMTSSNKQYYDWWSAIAHLDSWLVLIILVLPSSWQGEADDG